MGRRWVGRCIRVAWEGPAAESRRGPKKRLQLLLLACCCRCPLPRPFLTRGTCPLLLLLLLDIRPLDRTIQMPVNATFPLSFFACIRPLLILSCARTLSNIDGTTYNVETWEGSFHGDSQSRMQDVATTRTTITTTTSCPLN